MGDVRLSVEFKKCYLQSAASFSVAAKSFSQVQTILCHEVGGKTEQPSSRWRAFPSLCSFIQQGSRVSASTLLGYFIWLYSACVSFSGMQLQRAVSCWDEKCWHSPPAPPNQQTALSFWLKVSLLFLSCPPILHCWVALPQMPVSYLHCPWIFLLSTLWRLVS